MLQVICSFLTGEMAPWEHQPTRHTYVHLPEDIVAGHLNQNCDISNSTVPFNPVVFHLSLQQLSFYNCIKVMSKYTFKLYAVDWVHSGRVYHVSHSSPPAGSS